MIHVRITMEDAVNIGCVTPSEINDWYTDDYGVSVLDYEDMKECAFRRPHVWHEDKRHLVSPHAISIDDVNLLYMAGA